MTPKDPSKVIMDLYDNSNKEHDKQIKFLHKLYQYRIEDAKNQLRDLIKSNNEKQQTIVRLKEKISDLEDEIRKLKN